MVVLQVWKRENVKDIFEKNIPKIEFFFLMFLIGVISFGGGNMLIPVIYDELVIKSNIIKDD